MKQVLSGGPSLKHRYEIPAKAKSQASRNLVRFSKRKRVYI
jgi:hypothetical protein